MKEGEPEDQERQEVVKAEEAEESGMVYRVAASEPVDDGRTD